MLLDKVRENLGFKYFNSHDLNLILQQLRHCVKRNPLANCLLMRFPEPALQQKALV